MQFESKKDSLEQCGQKEVDLRKFRPPFTGAKKRFVRISPVKLGKLKTILSQSEGNKKEFGTLCNLKHKRNSLNMLGANDKIEPFSFQLSERKSVCRMLSTEKDHRVVKPGELITFQQKSQNGNEVIKQKKPTIIAFDSVVFAGQPKENN